MKGEVVSDERSFWADPRPDSSGMDGEAQVRICISPSPFRRATIRLWNEEKADARNLGFEPDNWLLLQR